MTTNVNEVDKKYNNNTHEDKDISGWALLPMLTGGDKIIILFLTSGVQ